MFRKTTYINQELDKEIESKLGGYNSMPPNWEEIAESEFFWLFGQKHANGYQDFRQVRLPSVGFGEGRDKLGSREMFCKVFLWVNIDLSGIGIIEHYNGQATRSREDAFFPQYFKFRYCEHDYETTAQSMCYWQGKCKKCGYVEAVDSSG